MSAIMPLDYAVAMAGLDADASGDGYLVRALPGGVLVAVVDGLGHGVAAERAAGLATATLQQLPCLPIPALFESCHACLKGTRGVVMTVATIDARESRLTWMAVGNVEGLLLREDAQGGRQREFVVMRGGIVGHRMPALQARSVAIEPGDLLILATDGVHPGFERDATMDRPPQEIADRILARHGKANDDALVLVGRWRGAETRTGAPHG